VPVRPLSSGFATSPLMTTRLPSSGIVGVSIVLPCPLGLGVTAVRRCAVGVDAEERSCA
jgi:hypothetical protein